MQERAVQPERAAVKLICHGALSCKLGKSLAAGLFASLCFLKSNCTVCSLESFTYQQLIT